MKVFSATHLVALLEYDDQVCLLANTAVVEYNDNVRLLAKNTFWEQTAAAVLRLSVEVDQGEWKNHVLRGGVTITLSLRVMRRKESRGTRPSLPWHLVFIKKRFSIAGNTSGVLLGKAGSIGSVKQWAVTLGTPCDLCSEARGTFVFANAEHVFTMWLQLQR